MNTQKQNNSRKSKPARYVFLFLCCAFAVGGFACATMLAVDSAESRDRARRREYHNEVILEDSIYAVARPDAELAKKLGTSEAMAFLGTKHIYMITTGGQKIVSIAAELDGDKLEIDTTASSRHLFKKGKSIWGDVILRYKPGGEAQEVDKLTKLGFTSDRRTASYTRSIKVAGIVLPPAKTDKPLPDRLKRNRDIAFYRPKDSAPPPGLEDLAAMVTIPLAVALDLALTPVYLAGFVILVISI